MSAAAFALALGSAFLHALWNILLARRTIRNPRPRSRSAPRLSCSRQSRRWCGTSTPASGRSSPRHRSLQLVYFALLATAYRRAELSFVYPIARGLAPVLVLRRRRRSRSERARRLHRRWVCAWSGSASSSSAVSARERDLDGRHACGGDRTLDRHLHARGQVRHPLRQPDRVPRARHGAGSRGCTPARRCTPFRAARACAPRPASPALAGVISFVAYVLVLAALERASAASVAAVRETSVLIVAALAATYARRERRPGPARGSRAGRRGDRVARPLASGRDFSRASQRRSSAP